MEWEQRKFLLICPLCFTQFHHDTSNPSPALRDVHIHQKHRKKGIGVQLGNIHQATKQKRVQDNTSFSLFKWDIWFGKRQKATRKKTSHPSHHRLALSIICLVSFHLESSRPVICVSHCWAFRGFSDRPFTVLISAFSLFLFVSFLGITGCLGWHISTLFSLSYLLLFHDYTTTAITGVS